MNSQKHSSSLTKNFSNIPIGDVRMFFVALLVAHAQAILIPAWIARRISTRRVVLRNYFPDRAITLLLLGFACFSIAAFAEMLDHTETSWIYINRLSKWNGLFYAGLASGLASLAASVTANKTLRVLLCSLVIAVIVSYPLLGKGTTICIQFIITIIFLAQWWKRFHDPLLWIYPICGVVLTTVFGGMLTASGDQIWHVFIGPAGSISLIILWLLLNRAEKRQSFSY